MNREELYQLVKEIHDAEYAVNVMLSSEYDALLEEKVTAKQIILLELVNETQKINIGELADRMEITPSAVSQLLGKLEKGGYTKRTINPENRREIFVELDERGTEFIAKQREIERSMIDRFYTKMRREDLLALRDITTRFKQIVEEELGRE